LADFDVGLESQQSCATRGTSGGVIIAGATSRIGGAVDWRNRIGADPDVLVGKPVVKGTRISVELVLELLAAGYTPEQVRQQYDHLTPEDIQACLAYAREVIRSERVFAVKS
jgi:uncharacterized protein (DUF433 family)